MGIQQVQMKIAHVQHASPQSGRGLVLKNPHCFVGLELRSGAEMDGFQIHSMYKLLSLKNHGAECGPVPMK
jgi:hypothetical protein